MNNPEQTQPADAVHDQIEEKTYEWFPLEDGTKLAESARAIVNLEKDVDASLQRATENLNRPENRPSGNSQLSLSYSVDHDEPARRAQAAYDRNLDFNRKVHENARAVSNEMIPEAVQDMEAAGIEYVPSETTYAFTSDNAPTEYLTLNELQVKLDRVEVEAAFEQQEYEAAMAHPEEGDDLKLEITKKRRAMTAKDADTLRKIISDIEASAA